MILYQDENFAIINKPAGLLVHDDGRTNEETLEDFLFKEMPEIKGVGEPMQVAGGKTANRFGIVHRIDAETSGLLLVAKTIDAFAYYKKLFQDRKIKKTYHAFVYGNIIEETGIIDEPIGRDKKNFRKRKSGKNLGGEVRDAVTEFKVLKRSADKTYSFLEVMPKTGRTHQIRVHLKSIYHPVVCDNLYAPERESLLGFKRLALHARALEFIDQAGRMRKFEAPYPDDFEEALMTLV